MTRGKRKASQAFSNGLPADAGLPPETRAFVEAALVSEPTNMVEAIQLVSQLVQAATLLQQNYPLAAEALRQKVLALQAKWSPG
jgi:hypothetical protein